MNVSPNPAQANGDNPVLAIFNRVTGLPGKIQGFVQGVLLGTIDKMQTEQALRDMHAEIEKERLRNAEKSQDQSP